MYQMGKPVGYDGKLRDGYVELDKSKIIIEVEEDFFLLFQNEMLRILNQWMIWSIILTLFTSLDIKEGKNIDKSNYPLSIVLFVTVLLIFEIVSIYRGQYKKKYAQALGAATGFLDGLIVFLVHADVSRLFQSKTIMDVFVSFLINIVTVCLLFTIFQTIKKFKKTRER